MIACAQFFLPACVAASGLLAPQLFLPTEAAQDIFLQKKPVAVIFSVAARDESQQEKKILSRLEEADLVELLARRGIADTGLFTGISQFYPVAQSAATWRRLSREYRQEFALHAPVIFSFARAVLDDSRHQDALLLCIGRSSDLIYDALLFWINIFPEKYGSRRHDLVIVDYAQRLGRAVIAAPQSAQLRDDVWRYLSQQGVRSSGKVVIIDEVSTNEQVTIRSLRSILAEQGCTVDARVLESWQGVDCRNQRLFSQEDIRMAAWFLGYGPDYRQVGGPDYYYEQFVDRALDQPSAYGPQIFFDVRNDGRPELRYRHKNSLLRLAHRCVVYRWGLQYLLPHDITSAGKVSAPRQVLRGYRQRNLSVQNAI